MKDILVHLDGAKHSPARLSAAIALAQRFGARLTGLFAQSDADRMAAIARRPSDHLRYAAETAASAFAVRTAEAGVTTRWWQMPHGEPGMVTAEFAFCAQYFDLVVMGQHDAKDSPWPADMVEQTVLECGRPVLILPSVGGFQGIGKRVVVAWNAGREATRALHDALPLLTGSTETVVLTMRSNGDGTAAALADMPPVDILGHLRAAGVPATGEHLPDEAIGKMDMLLSRACDLGADLLVMGAHGPSGLASMRSSGTRWMLRHLTLPVLMSH